MMEATKALAERVNAHCEAVESSAWAWAARLRMAAEECGAVEAVALADAVERTLATSAGWGATTWGRSCGSSTSGSPGTLWRLETGSDGT